MRSKFTIVDESGQADELILSENSLRDLKIRSAWDILGDVTEMKYHKKLQYLGKKYFLSPKSIEKIISIRPTQK